MAEKVADTTASLLARKIESGVYPPGSQLPPERRLAAELGVSRTAIREAFKQLHALGLVDAHVGRGRFVVDEAGDKRSHFLAGQLFDLHTNELSQLSVVRQLLEGEAIRAIPGSACPAVAAELLAILETASAALEVGDLDTVARLDSEFHATPLAYCPNVPLQVLANGVMVAMGESIRSVLSDVGRAEASLTEHRRIADAFSGGDIELAAALVSHHQSSSYRRSLAGQAETADG